MRRDGRPHVTPLPAVWDEGRLPFCTGPGEQKAVNLARNPHVALTTRYNRWKEGLDVVIEGDAVHVMDDSRLRTLADLWRRRYHRDWDFAVERGMFRHADGGSALVFEVAPTKVLAFAKGPFAQTRYRFHSASPDMCDRWIGSLPGGARSRPCRPERPRLRSPTSRRFSPP